MLVNLERQFGLSRTYGDPPSGSLTLTGLTSPAFIIMYLCLFLLIYFLLMLFMYKDEMKSGITFILDKIYFWNVLYCVMDCLAWIASRCYDIVTFIYHCFRECFYVVKEPFFRCRDRQECNCCGLRLKNPFRVEYQGESQRYFGSGYVHHHTLSAGVLKLPTFRSEILTAEEQEARYAIQKQQKRIAKQELLRKVQNDHAESGDEEAHADNGQTGDNAFTVEERRMQEAPAHWGPFKIFGL